MTTIELTAPLPPAAEAAMLRLERALATPANDRTSAMSPADRLAHDAASYVRQYGRVS